MTEVLEVAGAPGQGRGRHVLACTRLCPGQVLLQEGALVTGRAEALRCTVLYCTVLYCTVLYCTALYCTVLATAAHSAATVMTLDNPGKCCQSRSQTFTSLQHLRKLKK